MACGMCVGCAWAKAATWILHIQQALGSASDAAAALSHKAQRARWRLLNTTWAVVGDGERKSVLKSWSAHLTHERLEDRVQVAWFRREALEYAKRTSEQDARTSQASWTSHGCRRDQAVALGGCNRVSRTAAGWVPSTVSTPALMEGGVAAGRRVLSDGRSHDACNSWCPRYRGC